MLDNSIVLAAGSSAKTMNGMASQLQEGAQNLVNTFSPFCTVLQIIGGGIAFVCVILLLINWIRPNSKIGQAVGSHKAGFVAGCMILGVLLAAVKTTLPYFAYVIGLAGQGIGNIVLTIGGFINGR